MKYYLLVTGAAFALLVLAHCARIYIEGFYVLKEPVFLISSIVSVVLVIWAGVLFKRTFSNVKD